MVVEIIVSVILLFVGIAVLVIIHVCVVGRAFRGDPAPSAPPRFDRIPSMNPEEIKKLPWFDYAVEEKGVIMNVECAVCLEIFAAGERCRILPKCNHSFHAQCIDSWLLKTAACPICRAVANSSNCSSFEGVGDHGDGDGLQLV
ncbi:RING-H2 finger protein ATL74-like [Salvia miltiorrhiza]|uniref:RING-H2 finger protein ATL74-like n=1 Tax=Salvia miltiorrhiza TaxID=226208 RepID=UPI0025AD878B|nr:RING-H2 finger protein ATL74-like [Salvia miltiorrhiza]